MTLQQHKNTDTNKIIHNKTLSIIIAASAIMVMLTIGSQTGTAFATFDCTTDPNHCYAVHIYNVFFDVNGVQSTNKVLYMTGTAGTVTGATWAFLVDGNFLETDWQEQVVSGANHYFVWGLNGNPQHTWGAPSDNTYYTFTVEDLNKDKVWNMAAGGQSFPKTMATSLTHKLETGYELDPTIAGLTLREDDFKDMKYVYLATWHYWDSTDGTHTQFLNPNSSPPVLHVKYCGTGDEQYHHSQHGPGAAPPSCT